MTKEEFTELYNKEMEKLSRVESAIDELGFSMNGVVDVHKRAKSAFEIYADNHDYRESNNGFYYGYVANKVVQNWDSFMNVCMELWNFSSMTKGSLEKFYNYIYSAFEMMENGTFNFDDYLDEQFQTYMANLAKFFGNKITDDIFHTFAEYLKSKNDWNEDFFKC